MVLTGIQIFKMFKDLPDPNCGDCGVPTCLAFAMNLAAGKSDISKCFKLSAEIQNLIRDGITESQIKKGDNFSTLIGTEIDTRKAKNRNWYDQVRQH